jgi:hypothetical protein
MKITDLWPLAWEALQALRAHYGPAIDRSAEEFGIPFGEWYGWLMAAHIFEPSPISAARLHFRSAYTSPARLEEHLAGGLRLGLLEPVGEGEYRRTEAGQAAVQRLIDTAYAAMAPLRPLPKDELEQLAGLLNRLVAASLAAPEPPGKWCLRIARRYDPGADAPAMVRIDQYLSDLDAYRDDAHLAAWQPHGVSGQAWEALTLLWRGDATTADELHARLLRRGHAREAYTEALQELAMRDWAIGEGETYRLTGRGSSVREEAETVTNRYFFAAWACLSEAELVELRDLLTSFRDGLYRLRA